MSETFLIKHIPWKPDLHQMMGCYTLKLRFITQQYLQDYFINYYTDTATLTILVSTSGGLGQDFAGSSQNRVIAKHQVQAGSSHSAAQRFILLLPNLIDNIYFVICIGLIQRYLRL